MALTTRPAVLHDLNGGGGTWHLTRAEAAYDLARARQLGDAITVWDATDRAGRRIRVVRDEGVARDGTPVDGVYITPG